MIRTSKDIFRREETQRLLKAFKDGKIRRIDPVLDYEKGVEYPEVGEIVGAHGKIVEETLEGLAETDILTREVRDMVATCSKCNSHRMTLHLYCPSCKSANLKKGSMIEHFECGYLDFEDNFMKGERLVCPKCGKELRMIGTDYRRAGVFYRCQVCGETLPNPEKRYTCGSCGHTFHEHEYILREIPAYRLNPGKKKMIERETVSLAPLKDKLAEIGWYGKTPISLTGSSGVEHNFAAALWDPTRTPERDPPCILIDVIFCEEEVGVNSVLAFFAKTLDFRPRDEVLIGSPKFEGKAKILADGYGIFTAEAEHMGEIEKKTEELVFKLIRKRDEEALKAEAKVLEEALKGITSKKVGMNK